MLILPTVMRKKAAAGGAFDPLDLFAGSEEGGWWTFDDATSYTDAGTTLVTAVDDAVQQVNDLSGNANHMKQGTSNLRGLWQDPGVEFDDINDRFETDALSSTINGTELVFVAVCRFDGTRSWQRITSGVATSGGSDTGSTAAAGILRNSGNNEFAAYQGGAVKSTVASTNSTYYIVESVFDGTNHTLYVNGTAGTPVSSTNTFAIDYLRVGWTASTASFSTVKELIILDRAFTGSEQTDLRSYLNTKHSVF